ncbi:MAG: histidinol dehydrogenase [Verrucomicrobiales bacterium]|jgi:histidinol dehydrogenase|nr:histidinol dehydrogenase [Verrucomicrobiales bacterium]MDC0313017.1 histidinol dehydrogenase [Verrucomicrobiales bacterium]MDF1786266.1 histidinol dehydrogenase [Verrucomicrobiales bacterium]
MEIIKHTDADYAEKRARLNRRAAPAPEVEATVAEILETVRTRGDAGLLELTEKFDGATLTAETLRVTEAVMAEARESVSDEVREAVAAAKINVKTFAEESMRRDWSRTNAQGAEVGERFQAFERVGIYVPGGSAPLVSTAIMTVTLATAAGVPQIVVTTPCDAYGKVNPALLYALGEAGAHEVYKVGGAQALGALAYGTATIKPVIKVFGPGNAYVMEAKRQVFGSVSVDLLPGPSEVLVLADETANPAFIAADMLAQAEHDPVSLVGFVTPSAALLERVVKEVEKQKPFLSRSPIIDKVLANGTFLLLVEDFAEGVAIANDYAPEHLSLVCADEDAWIPKITTSGGIFVGNYSPVAVGDFLAGPSHELPTGGAGKSFPGLTVDQFQRRTSVVKLDREAIAKSAPIVSTFCAVEGLDAHARSATIRLAEES